MQDRINIKNAELRAAHLLDEANQKGLNALGTLYDALIKAYYENEQLKQAKG